MPLRTQRGQHTTALRMSAVTTAHLVPSRVYAILDTTDPVLGVLVKVCGFYIKQVPTILSNFACHHFLLQTLTSVTIVHYTCAMSLLTNSVTTSLVHTTVVVKMDFNILMT